MRRQHILYRISTDLKKGVQLSEMQVCCYDNMNAVDYVTQRFKHTTSSRSLRRCTELFGHVQPSAVQMPVTSVECERTVSLQNRLKTKLRNRLVEDRVNVLMKLIMGGAHRPN